MQEVERTTPRLQPLSGILHAEEYLSVRDAARILGVSTRSVYGYIEAGKLQGIRIGSSIAVQAEAIRNYQRTVVGRPRVRTPVWRVPVAMNLQYLTSITVRARKGRGGELEQRLERIRASGEHRIPGTVARYIVRSQVNPDNILIVLIWRRLAMPPAEEREAALAALRAELDDILAWETAEYSEGRVIMNA